MAIFVPLQGIIFAVALISSAAALGDTTAPHSPETKVCSVNTAAMLRLSPDKFDQDMQGGWRTLAEQSGCEKAAADLIKAYISQNWGKIKPENLHVLYWHAGQMEALAGNDRQAIPLMMAGVNPNSRGQQMGFYEYALGTISFLNKDLAGLKAARQRLSALPEPDWYSAEFTAGHVTRWPANLSVLDNLIRCFGSPYSIAYSGDCQP